MNDILEKQPRISFEELLKNNKIDKKGAEKKFAKGKGSTFVSTAAD